MVRLNIISDGDKYGFITLTGESEFRYSKGSRYVEGVCVCGKKKYFALGGLKSGNIKSCGCKKAELNRGASTIHGLGVRGTPGNRIYGIWVDMKQRCYNENLDCYNNYGGRGIVVSEEWINDPVAFYEWAINNGYAAKLRIERINNDGNYEPSNCTWATPSEQMKNTRRTRFLTAFGETKCMADWVDDERCIVGKATFRARIDVSGWKPEDAMTIPQVLDKDKRTYKIKQCA